MFRLPCCGCRLRWQLWRVAWPKRMSLFMGLRSQECQHGRIFQKRQQRAANFSGCCGTGRRESSISAAFPAKAQVRVNCGLHWYDPSPIHAECVHDLHVESFHRKRQMAGQRGQRQPSKYPFKFQASVFRSLPWNSLQASIITSCKLPVEQRWQESWWIKVIFEGMAMTGMFSQNVWIENAQRLALGAALRAFHVLDGSHKLAHGVNSLGTLWSALQIANLLRVTQELSPFDCITENLHQMLEFLCCFIRPVDSFRQKNSQKSSYKLLVHSMFCPRSIKRQVRYIVQLWASITASKHKSAARIWNDYRLQAFQVPLHIIDNLEKDGKGQRDLDFWGNSVLPKQKESRSRSLH